MHLITFDHVIAVIIAGIVITLIWRTAIKLQRRKNAHDAEAVSFADDMRMSDDEYAEAITGGHRVVAPEPSQIQGDRVFSYDGLYRTDIPGAGVIRHIPEQEPTDMLVPLPPQRTRADVLPEVDDYITGRAVRIIRRAEEERKEWHWDELLGQWKPPVDRIRELEWDDWLRQLLLSENVEVSA